MASWDANQSSPAPARPRAPRRAGTPQLAVLKRRLGAGHPPAETPIREHGPRQEVARRDAIFRSSLVAADMLAAVFSLLLCVEVVGNTALRPMAMLALPLLLLAGKAQNLYDRDELLINKTTIDQGPQLFHLATLFALLVFVLQDAFVAGVVGPVQVVLLWGSLLFLAIGLRRIARRFARSVTTVERCLFVGGEDSHKRLLSKLDHADRRAVVVGRMSLTGEQHGGPTDPVAVMRELIGLCGVHRVIIEPGEGIPQTTLDFVREAKATGARVSLLPRILEVVGSAIEIDDLDGLTLLGVRRFGLSRWSRAVKRSFDVAGASLGLLALAPVFGLFAALVKLGSRGPVFYRQTRVGRDGEPFRIWKFRTMVDGAHAMRADLADLNESEGLFKIAADPRVTRAGRLLRRTSLDELPQLINVLRGEMSLVGPRPLILPEDALITGLDRRRLSLTPGMTGHWQILGSNVVPLAEMVKLDYLYVAGWSLWSDVKILLRTVPHVLASRGV